MLVTATVIYTTNILFFFEKRNYAPKKCVAMLVTTKKML